MTRSRLPQTVVKAVDAAKILGVRSGTEHRFIGVWPVVVNGRVFARSWGRSAGGWYRSFLEEPRGAIQVGDREVKVRGVPVKSEKLRDAVEAAYAAKYTTPASQKWVRGFRAKSRREATIEFRPR